MVEVNAVRNLIWKFVLKGWMTGTKAIEFELVTSGANRVGNGRRRVVGTLVFRVTGITFNIREVISMRELSVVRAAFWLRERVALKATTAVVLR